MRDRREEILARALVVLSGITLVPALVQVVRNQFGLGDTRRPAIILLDGDEQSLTRNERAQRGLRLPPQLVMMTPQVFYLAGDLPENTTIGAHLNIAKIKIMDALASDPVLVATCGNNGGIHYGGAETDMKTGSSMEGQLQVNPVFVYPFLASELKGVQILSDDGSTITSPDASGVSI